MFADSSAMIAMLTDESDGDFPRTDIPAAFPSGLT
jgi:uncharacterized protein with PIN domain